MRTPIQWAELHSPLFLSGKNLSQKLDPNKVDGLSMEFDEEKHQLYVTYKNPTPAMGMPAVSTARVPEPSILSMVEGEVKKRKETPMVVPKVVKAQASSPQDHVFAGLGAGETGQAKPKMKF